MNILAIGAHYDDIELGVGGTIAKHIDNGDNVIFVVVTESDYTDHSGLLRRSKSQAEKEGIEAAAKLGVDTLINLGRTTKKVQYGVELIEDLNAIIDEHKIDTIYTHWNSDVHQDHHAIAKATFNAGRHVPRILMYRSNWYHTTEPFRDNFHTDISPYVSLKAKSLRAHTTEYERRGEEWIDFVIHQNRNCGIRVGVRHAEAFEIVKWLN
jgi:LmbE family N-acetylglucosaminyl deacetylase|tara:strand:- start:358 stop:987 length:630 start_codon:yes stop_codon:yes gene_type:complete